jgi:hypothetical protein
VVCRRIEALDKEADGPIGRKEERVWRRPPAGPDNSLIPCTSPDGQRDGIAC